MCLSLLFICCFYSVFIAISVLYLFFIIFITIFIGLVAMNSVMTWSFVRMYICLLIVVLYMFAVSAKLFSTCVNSSLIGVSPDNILIRLTKLVCVLKSVMVVLLLLITNIYILVNGRVLRLYLDLVFSVLCSRLI